MKIRAATHVHSNWSYDGSWPLSSISSYFKKLGYNCVLMSEHDESFDESRWRTYREACNKKSSDDFLIIPGIEYSDSLNIVHMLVWGDIPFLGAGRETEALLTDIRQANGVAVMSHPSRREAWQKYKSQWSPLLLGIEQWNRKVDGVAPSREAISIIKQNLQLIPFAGLDFHRANQFFPLYIALQIDGKLIEDAVLKQFREKRIRAELAGIAIDYFSHGTLFAVINRVEQFRRYLRNIIKGK